MPDGEVQVHIGFRGVWHLSNRQVHGNECLDLLCRLCSRITRGYQH